MRTNFVYGYAAIIIAFVLITTSASAQATTTCAEMLRRQFNITVALSIGIPVIGWVAGIINASGLSEKQQDIKHLEAATNITRNLRPKNETAAAWAMIDKFYNILLKMYPTMTLGKEEVVFVLHKFNINSVDNGRCTQPLINSLFPDENASSYIIHDRKWLAETEQRLRDERGAKERNAYEAARAAEERNRKIAVVTPENVEP